MRLGFGFGLPFTRSGTQHNLDFMAGALPSGTTLTRASTGTRFNDSGVLVTEAIDAARFDYQSSTLALRGLLVEPSRQNHLLHNNDFSAAPWSVVRASISVNAIAAPDGTTSADKLVEDTSVTNSHVLLQSYAGFTVGSTYTFSIFAKAGERDKVYLAFSTAAFPLAVEATFDLAAGSVLTPGAGLVDYGIEALANDWFHIWIAATADATASSAVTILPLDASGNAAYTGDGTSGLYIWGAQLEAAAFPTAVIPTDAGPITRASDALTLTAPRGDGTHAVVITAGTTDITGVDYGGSLTVTSGVASFAWPAAAVAAGERHLQRVMFV